MKMEITNDFSESEHEFVIELKHNVRGVPYTRVINKYAFCHPMLFLKAMTDGLVDEIEKSGLKVFSSTASEPKPVEKTQRQEPVDPPVALRLTENERMNVRTKALELALEAWGEDLNYASERDVTETAQRFYTYITKGE